VERGQWIIACNNGDDNGGGGAAGEGSRDGWGAAVVAVRCVGLGASAIRTFALGA